MTNLLRTPRLEDAAAACRATLTGARSLAGDGSDRRFYRLAGSPPVILLWHPSPPGGEVNENDSYFWLGRHLRSQGVPVPEIFTYCREEGWMLMEDLGDVSLEATIKEAPGENPVSWYRQALAILVNLQLKGREGFDPSWCFDTPVVDRAFLLERECGYFVTAFLQGYWGLKVEADDLAPDFDKLLSRALPADGAAYFLHRDYQSRNLYIKKGLIRVIDFQGGRLGPLSYDVAALLIDPYVNLAPSLQDLLREDYLTLLQARLHVDRAAFREQYHHLALCRNLQILGAFAFLTRVKGKVLFEAHIPPALAGLRRRLAARRGEFPRLEKVVAQVG
jgi:aminoglycoside/choline kinase family phosphotransferase